MPRIASILISPTRHLVASPRLASPRTLLRLSLTLTHAHRTHTHSLILVLSLVSRSCLLVLDQRVCKYACLVTSRSCLRAPLSSLTAPIPSHSLLDSTRLDSTHHLLNQPLQNRAETNASLFPLTAPSRSFLPHPTYHFTFIHLAPIVSRMYLCYSHSSFIKALPD